LNIGASDMIASGKSVLIAQNIAGGIGSAFVVAA
jgi:hypothetical protein